MTSMSRHWSLALALLVLGCGASENAGGSDVEKAGWRAHAPLPEPRTEVAAARAGNQIVVVGGFVGSGTNSRRADAYAVEEDR